MTFLLGTLTDSENQYSECSNKNQQRRSSVPVVDSFHRLGSTNGKSRNRKKILRRRSSGGAEILGAIVSESMESDGTTTTTMTTTKNSSTSTSAWYKFKRDVFRRPDSETLLSRRRGSLPVEVLSVCHSGESSNISFSHPLKPFFLCMCLCMCVCVVTADMPCIYFLLSYQMQLYLNFDLCIKIA